MIDMLSKSGISRVEATSFVSPKWVPQLADADAVMRGIQRHEDVQYSVLTPNMKVGKNSCLAVASRVQARHNDVCVGTCCCTGYPIPSRVIEYMDTGMGIKIQANS